MCVVVCVSQMKWLCGVVGVRQDQTKEERGRMGKRGKEKEKSKREKKNCECVGSFSKLMKKSKCLRHPVFPGGHPSKY